MKLRIEPSSPSGTVRAIASKSAAHRQLICAAFADAPVVIRCEETNDDISATVRCLRALGARIERRGGSYCVSPIEVLAKRATLDCGESGSTLRFLLPVVCALGVDADFMMAGRLPARPLSPLRELLEENGITFSPIGSNPLTVRGKLTATEFSVEGNVSSQFISGLLLALAVSEKSGRVSVVGELESAPYVDMTVDALRAFGVSVEKTNATFALTGNGGLRAPAECSVEGDWSAAAFWLALGAIGTHPITVRGLDLCSGQGDRAILSLLAEFGARVTETDGAVTVAPAPLRGISIDARQIPDLVPILATVAAVAEGQTEICGVARLRLKESDRLRAVCATLGALGASVVACEDRLLIDGVASLRGGEVSSFGDHRIAMSAAIAACACELPVTVEGAEAVTKSYPDFWEHLASLGTKIER